MKKGIICIMLAMAISATASAQNKDERNAPRPAHKPAKELSIEDIAKQRADRMRRELLLGNEQYDKVYKLMLKKVEKENRRKAEAKAEDEALNKDMAKILNEAQLERYNDNRKPKFRGWMHPGRRPQMGPGPKFQMGPGRKPQMGPGRRMNHFEHKPGGMPFPPQAQFRPAPDSSQAKKPMPTNNLRKRNAKGTAIEPNGDPKLNQNLYKMEGEKKE